MLSGFQFDETMTGDYALADSPYQHAALSFSVRVHAESWLQYLRDKTATLSGTLDAPGLAEGVPIKGSIVIAPISRRVIAYDFNFTGNDGNPYRFHGQKDIRLRGLLRTLTELPAQIHDGVGNLVATTLVRFDLRSDLFSFVRSFRPAARAE